MYKKYTNGGSPLEKKKENATKKERKLFELCNKEKSFNLLIVRSSPKLVIGTLINTENKQLVFIR